MGETREWWCSSRTHSPFIVPPPPAGTTLKWDIRILHEQVQGQSVFMSWLFVICNSQQYSDSPYKTESVPDIPVVDVMSNFGAQWHALNQITEPELPIKFNRHLRYCLASDLFLPGCRWGTGGYAISVKGTYIRSLFKTQIYNSFKATYRTQLKAQIFDLSWPHR